ncbi:metallophosphoesterase [Candidatus Woesearchaeota archaeon]|nr:metallophosphoesterase [Candidatus Woesearchaeota archaeon]
MEIAPHLEIIGTALWLATKKILIINDLHLGYEEALQQKGVLIPKFQLREIITRLEQIFQKVKPKKIIINGDLKHEFGRILRQEWDEVLRLIDFLLQHCPEVVIIRGNHDPVIAPIAQKRRTTVVTEYRTDNTLIVHGDELVKTDARRIIIGHEHPAITIREGSKWEKYKCFLKGKWEGKELIAVPSFNPLLEGTDILKEQTLSPFLKNLNSFEVFIINELEVFDFGKVKEIRKKNEH